MVPRQIKNEKKKVNNHYTFNFKFRLKKKEITISTSSKEMEKVKQTIRILRQNLMKIVTSMVAMVTKNLIATKRKGKKITKEMKM